MDEGGAKVIDANGSFENDVVIVDKTIPNVVVSDVSFDQNQDAKLEDDQLIDLTILDADELTTPKHEPKWLSEGYKEHEPKISEQVIIKDGKSAKKDDVLLLHCAIRQSFTNENFVLNIENSDDLHSYLDTDQSQENLKIETKAVEGEKVCDSLILTADDELESEEMLPEKLQPVLANVMESLLPPIDAPKTFKDGQKEDESEENETNKKSTVSPKEKAANSSLPPSRFLWVSNVTHSVRASDLKQYISKIGKVITAKIVTDGKKCYGHVVMDNAEDAAKCLKHLNNAYFEGRKILLSFTRPQQSIPESKDVLKKKDVEKKVTPEKKEANNPDEKFKASKEIPVEVDKNSRKKRCASQSSSRAKNMRTNDPLTIKFEDERRVSSNSGGRSRSRSRHRDYLREREEKERLQRKLTEERRKNRQEILRQIHREEKHREMEFKLEQDRRKLQLEREMFDKERRELTRLDAERRKIERERLDILQQRSKLQEELQKSRLKPKPDEFKLSSVIGKISEVERNKDPPKMQDYRKAFPKFGKGRKIPESKIVNVSNHRSNEKLAREHSKRSKSYERIVPPPPKLSNDFDLSTNHKTKYPERKHEPDRKSERKIEVIDRNFYSESERKHERNYRKDFEDRKGYSERKYDYGRDAKRYKEEAYPERENATRNQWSGTSAPSYGEPWKQVAGNQVSGAASTRYQEPNFTVPPYGGPSRMPPFYFQSIPAPQDYSRYDHSSQVTGRKYN